MAAVVVVYIKASEKKLSNVTLNDIVIVSITFHYSRARKIVTRHWKEHRAVNKMVTREKRSGNIELNKCQATVHTCRCFQSPLRFVYACTRDSLLPSQLDKTDFTSFNYIANIYVARTFLFLCILKLKHLLQHFIVYKCILCTIRFFSKKVKFFLFSCN